MIRAAPGGAGRPAAAAGSPATAASFFRFRGKNPGMDWCVDRATPGAVDLLEEEICSHLDRHASEPAVVELARPLIRQALERPPAGPVWVAVDWEEQEGQLRISPLATAALPGTPAGPGVTRAHDAVAELMAAHGGGDAASVALRVARITERDIDPGPADPDLLPDDRPAHLIGLMAADMAEGHSFEEAAARAGATVAEREIRRGSSGGDAEQVARALVETERRLGADFEIISSGHRRAVLHNRRCPFGSTATAMCRFTSALAGGMAARATGAAEINVVESLAAGDHECRLVIETDGSSRRPVAHRYTWPPPSAPEPQHKQGGRGFQVSLSLQLPRDRLSVPVTRHLVRSAMKEVGVVTEDADAVELAVTEACANVIDHSGPGDAYDVMVSIGTAACHIRVVDVGRGFDHAALSVPSMAATDSEHGRGVALMHALVDQVRFESVPEQGTVVHLVKHLRFDDSATARRLMLEGGNEGEDG